MPGPYEDDEPCQGDQDGQREPGEGRTEALIFAGQPGYGVVDHAVPEGHLGVEDVRDIAEDQDLAPAIARRCGDDYITEGLAILVGPVSQASLVRRVGVVAEGEAA